MIWFIFSFWYLIGLITGFWLMYNLDAHLRIRHIPFILMSALFGIAFSFFAIYMIYEKFPTIKRKKP